MKSNLLSQDETALQYLELPPELTINIFHYAARLSTRFCLTLCQVSRWTRRLALPHLYSTVVLRNHRSSASYIQTLLNPPFSPPKYDFEPSTVLQSLWIGAVSNRILTIFKHCDNLTHLALHADNLLWLIYGSSSDSPTLRLSHDTISRKRDLHITITKGHRWSLQRFVNEDPTLTTPLFSKITHLRLARAGDYEKEIHITHFSRLTHLAVPFWLPSHDLGQLTRLLSHRSLECLVLVVYKDLVHPTDQARVELWFAQMCQVDRRVCMVELTSDVVERDWNEEVRGGQDFWSKVSKSSL